MKTAAPSKRRGKGVSTRKMLNGGVDPLVGKATQIQPGEVRNPTGRPKEKIVSAEYERLGRTLFPGDPQGRTWMQLVVEGQMKAAIMGKTPAAKEYADRTEGPVVQAIEVGTPEGKPLSLTLNVRFTDPEPEKTK